MLYRCYGTWIDLARIVSVSEIDERSHHASQGARFCVHVSGMDHPLWFIASGRSSQHHQVLITTQEGLLANWRRFKASRVGLPEAIWSLGDLHLNLAAVSVLTGIEEHRIGMGGGGAPTVTTPGYSIHIMGMREPIHRRVGPDGVSSGNDLEREHEALLAAWANLHVKLVKGAA